MAYQRLQPSRALPIIPTDDLILPGGPGAILPNPPESFTLTLSDNIFTVIGESYAVYSVVEGGGAVLWVSTGGSILGKTAGGDDIVLNNVPDGSLLPILMSVINQTGTTATGMYGLW